MVVQLLGELVRIPSVNPLLDPEHGTGEQAVAEFARAWLEAHGVEAWLEPVVPGRPNVVARLGSGEPVLVLYGHLDTVQAREMEIPPFEPKVENGRLYGRGAFDMKCGVAASMVTAARLAAEGRLKGTLLLALVSDEEHSSVGAQAFVKRHRADGCILSEPTNGFLITAHRGFAWLDIQVRGRAAHGSRWDVGVSANAMAGRFLVALDQFDREVLRQRVHPDVGPASLHPAQVRGGDGMSTYAPFCLVQVEYRTLPGQTEAEVVREMAELAQQCGVEAEVACTLFRPAMVCPPDSKLTEYLVEAIGRRPELWNNGGWSDAALFDAAGIPAVMYGPTGDGAHEKVEWVDLATVQECVEIYFRAAQLFCGVM